MGKFILRETKDMGISPWTSICQVGSRVHGRYKFGTITIMFNEVMAARVYINAEVLRSALLDNPERTSKLLGIEVKDLKTPREITPTTVKVIDPELGDVIEDDLVYPEDVEESDESIDNLVEDIVIEIPVEETEVSKEDSLELKTKAELIELGKQHNIDLNDKMTKSQMLDKLTEEMEG